MGAGLVHIDVGVGFKANDDIAIVDDLVGHLAVQIKRDSDGRMREGGAHTFEQIARADVRALSRSLTRRMPTHTPQPPAACGEPAY